MSEKRIGSSSAKRNSTDWEQIQSQSDASIRAAIETDPDAHPTDENFWRNAEVVLPQPKQTVTIRLDADLLAWFRQQKGYQTRINAVLRTYMEAHKS